MSVPSFHAVPVLGHILRWEFSAVSFPVPDIRPGTVAEDMGGRCTKQLHAWELVMFRG